ncbi:MAG: sulfatase [Candidatus Nanosalina sp.]
MSGHNVVVLILDSLRKDRVSVYNEEVSFTPNMESIADDSTVYLNANAQAPWTLPSVTSIFTGKYPWEHGATHGKGFYEGSDKLLAERFREEGYNTKLVTPNVWMSETIGNTDGFQEVQNFLGVAENKHLKKIISLTNKYFSKLPKTLRKNVMKAVTELDARILSEHNNIDPERTISKAEEFISDLSDEKFFLVVNTLSPHEPYDRGNPPEEYIEKHGVDPEKVPSTEKEFFRSDSDEEELKKAYDAAADYTDDLVGRLNQAITENELEEDTVFVIMSDHGQALCEDGLFGHQFTLMDSVIETPLIVKSPEEHRDQVEEIFELRQLYDLIPALAGITNKKVEPLGESRGGYEFPDSYISVAPKEKREELDRKLRYYRNTEYKVTKSETRSGKTFYEARKEDNQKIEPTEEMKKRVDEISSDKAETSEEIDRDEEVKERLEKLGYR